MRHYEIMLLIHPDHSDQVLAMLERYTQLIQSKQGIIHRLENERRELTYPIKKLKKAHYILMNIECDDSLRLELEDSFAFNDSIIRRLIIRTAYAITEPSILTIEGQALQAQRKEKAIADKQSTQALSDTDSTDSDASDTSSDALTEKSHQNNVPTLHYNLYRKRKFCYFTSINATEIDYKDVELLTRYKTETQKIAPRRTTGIRPRYQRMLAKAFQRARLVGLLPYCDKYDQPNIG